MRVGWTCSGRDNMDKKGERTWSGKPVEVGQNYAQAGRKKERTGTFGA
jgi:hypothetical protein